MSEAEIEAIFVEPVNLLTSVLSQRQHFLLRGGRGAGKTITLRKLSHSVSPPSTSYPHLGIFVSLDAYQCSPFEETKIGQSNASIFESYLVGILLEQLLAAVSAHREFLLGTTNERELILVTQCLDRLHIADSSIETLDDFQREVRHVHEKTRMLADTKLDLIRLADLDVILRFALLNEICAVVRKQFAHPHEISIFFLLDRYGDMSPFQQSIANHIFCLPPTRHFHVRASIRPPALDTYDLHSRGSMAEGQDYRTVDLETLLTHPQYEDLLRAIVKKQLIKEELKYPGSRLTLNADELLASPTTEIVYAGVKAFALLSNGIVYNFLLLLEKAVFFATNLSDILLGSAPISAHAQAQAAREVARIAFDAIASTTGEHTRLQYLIRHAMQLMVSNAQGPRIHFKSADIGPFRELINYGLRESVFKAVRIAPSVDGESWPVELNRILLPKKDLPLVDRSPLEITDSGLTEIIEKADAVTGWSKRAKDPLQGEMFPKHGIEAAKPLVASYYTSRYGGREDLDRFMRILRSRKDVLLENLDYSESVSQGVKRELEQQLYPHFKSHTESLATVAVVLAGSFARREAIRDHSDADLFVLANASDHNLALEVLEFCSEWFRRQKIKAPPINLKMSKEQALDHPFPTVIDSEAITANVAKGRDTNEQRTRRMCILTESIGIFNANVLSQARLRVHEVLRTPEFLKANLLPQTFLREFRIWCNEFLARPEVMGQVGVKYDKRRLQRMFMSRVTPLSCLAHISRGSEQAFDEIPEILDLPPILRLYQVSTHVPEEIKENVERLVAQTLELYNDCLRVLAQIEISQSNIQAESERQNEARMKNMFDELEQVLLSTVSRNSRDMYNKIYTS